MFDSCDQRADLFWVILEIQDMISLSTPGSYTGGGGGGPFNENV